MSASAASLDHVTPYDRFAWSDLEVCARLASGAQRAELMAYFGAREYRVLAALARRAQRVARDESLAVLLIPGIMGSQLGLRRAAPLPDNILWLDPMDIQQDRLRALRLPPVAPIVPLGVMLFSYLRLLLYLRAHGFAAEFHDYDWRLPVADCARALAARLAALRPRRVALVAHSMGGLVSRAALALPGSAHIERLVMLGTPNAGSFAAVQALRGSYAVVRKVARLAAQDSAESLAAGTFNTFPSLYELLPRGVCAGRLDLFEPRNWPGRGPQPLPELLAAASALPAQLAPADARCHAIVGVGVETVTAVTRRGEEFIYTVTRDGDGTVPAASAQLAGAGCAFTRVAHSELTRDAGVAQAVVQLLRRGRAAGLPLRWRRASRARAQVSDAALRRTHQAKVDWGALSAHERQRFLENLNEPPRLRLKVPRARR